MLPDPPTHPAAFSEPRFISPFGRGSRLRALVVTANACPDRRPRTTPASMRPKMMEYPKRKFVTAVTSSEAGSEHVNRAVDTDAPSAPNLGSCSCRSGQALVSNPPDETGLPAPCCCGRRRGRGASSAHRVRARASALAGVRSTARSPRGRRPSTARRRALRDRTRGRATAARGGRASSIFEGSGPGSDGIGRRYGTYACRHCHRALHASQKNNQIGRKRLQASKLRLDLGGLPDINESFPTKPKWIRKRRRFRK
jgi:hypothetical protein